MPAPDQTDTVAPEKLSIIVFSGTYEKIHYALVMASAAAAVDKPVTLFFTMEAIKAVIGDDNHPGWRTLPKHETSSKTGSVADRALAEKNIAQFEDLLDACKSLGVVFMVCEMGMKAMGISRENLRPDIPFDVGGVVTFLNDANQNGAMLFI